MRIGTNKLTVLRCVKFHVADHRVIKLTQGCVCFTNRDVNLLVLPSLIREHRREVGLLELPHLLQCSAYLHMALTWVSE